ncbi:MAG: divergent polysaccharide deacetylase family protein [Deltaproteobacteria bacterium]|nr:divergent polysaccharide deacetylase family protein [Deltaproteobacteria bacterium]
MGRQRKNRGLLKWGGLLALGFIAGAAFVFFLLENGYIQRPSPEVKPPIASIPEERPLPPEAPPPEAPQPPEAPPGYYPRVAIVIDDMGQDPKKLKELLKLKEPITIAVIPHLRYSREVALQASSNGLEVLLHLPMEPKDTEDNDPGKGALLTAMSADEVRAQVEQDLKAVPNAIGVNNHMGSKFTEDEILMRAVLQVVKKKEMFFLDSRTSSNSVAGRLARELGVRNADRNVFLDNNRDVKYIKGQISELVSIARKRGKAIGIGHPYPETIEALKETVSGLDGKGIVIVKLSEIVEQ